MNKHASTIKQHLRTNGEVDLFALVNEFGGGSVYTLLEQVKVYAQKYSVGVGSAFPLKQAEQVCQRLSERVAAEQLLDALCNELSLLQTANMIGKYCNDTSCDELYGSSADVVMFGDSITEAAEWHEIFPGVNIVNRAIGGDVTSGMNARLHTVISCEPQKVFIMAGINDIHVGCPMAQILQRYEKMIDVIVDNGIELFVQSTLYVGERLKDYNAKVAQLNHGLIKLCSSKQVQYVDVACELCPNGLLPDTHSYDDLHLNARAYKKWASLIERFIL